VKDPSEAADNTEVTALPAPAAVPQPVPPTPVPAAPVRTAPIPPAGPALSEEHLRQLTASHAATRKIRRAISVARADGWGVGVFGAMTLIFGITSISGVILGAALCAVAFIELWSAGRLRRLEWKASRVLGFNQLALAGTLIVYASWRIYHEMNGTGDYAAIAASDPQLGQMLAPVEDLTRLITLAIYGGMIAVAVFAQGGLALYYFTREKYVRDYVAQTPEWVLAVQKAGSIL
jgi:hypothetical protein